MGPTRRRFIGGAAALASGGVAGCTEGLGEGAGGERNDDAYAAFFTLEQFAGAVAGDSLTVENPIPVGELGHHYEVSTEAQLEVARSRAFVYVGLEGFQRWAVDTAANIRDDHPEVTLIDAVESVDPLDAGGHDHEDDHENFDPHFWLDPVRAIESVGTVRDGLKEADPENADAYESNAADYVDRLSALDESFREELSDRDVETVVVASHDSFGYLADRYGFEVHSPTGVSPNAEPGSAEIRDTIELIDDHDVDVVLHDVFESPNLAETIVADSGAESAMPLSSVAGTRTEWQEAGWGYVEQMKEINLPALKAALKAE